MLKALAVAATIVALNFSYAFAADDSKMDKTMPMTMECTDADMMKMNKDIDGMSSAENKKMAMSHMSMAKDSMAKKDMEACKMHMKEAHDAMGKS